MTRSFRLLTTAASVLVLATAARAADPEFTVLDWAGWEIDGMLQPYVDKHGQKPSYVFYADDDEAFQKVSSGFKADVVHPCSAAVPRYKDAGLIEPWDPAKIPEFANIPARMTEAFKDDAGQWFIPTDYAYTAIAYNKETVPEADVGTLQVFADPKYAGRISLPDNTDDIWSLAFLATGLTNWDSVTDEQFQAAADWLRKVHPNVRSYWADPSELSQLMASGEVQIAWSWNDPVAILLSENFPVGFNRAPAEGAATWFCGFVNMKDAPGSEDKAYDFINSLLAHSSAQPLLDAIGYALSNDAAMAEIPAETLKASYIDPVTTTLFAQTPTSQEFRDKMIEEFELIKSGF
ncbi:extracellular solute-binding protein [Rhodobacter sp. Har01]|uniref:ABC transporter substrate-binding protein n=1 Tax=Rhodobacter sp. Har01 TaxID=2883999 RepID=UPI001D07C2DF|nr:extracellular solute-binding protein [Rhodobacter sp. Har01]MCB6176671.1 extracellular solute-binding protein [Rhodobacter sp. Har01]